MIFERVCDIVAAQLNIPKENIAMETNLRDDLHLDSLDLLEYVVLIEHEFDIVVPDDVMPDFETMQDVVLFIEENLH